MQRSPADRFASVTQFIEALRADATPVRSPMPRRAVLAAVGVLALVAAGWWATQGNRIKGDLDPNVIAVMPFRVGGEGSTAYLRESMLDLLNARLPGGTGPRIVEPRTALSAWRREVGNEQEDLSEEQSRRLAAQLGAGRVLLGSAIATPTELTLTGSLIRVADGNELANGSVSGMPDSVAVLVNRLVARLLSQEAGESRERLDGLAATSLEEALQDYLAARKAYRRGDYFKALALDSSAFSQLDSNFAQAAFGLVTTNPLVGTVFNTSGFRAIPALWRVPATRLSPRDLALLRGMTFVGPNYPGPSTYAEILAQAEARGGRRGGQPGAVVRVGQWASGTTVPWPACRTGPPGPPMRSTTPSRSTQASLRQSGNGSTWPCSSGIARRSATSRAYSSPGSTSGPETPAASGQPHSRSVTPRMPRRWRMPMEGTSHFDFIGKLVFHPP